MTSVTLSPKKGDCYVCLADIKQYIVKCPFCNYESCVKCAIKYILDSYTFAKCMNCKKFWTISFLIQNFNVSWVISDGREGSYFYHLKHIWIEEEKSKIPQLIEEMRFESNLMRYNKILDKYTGSAFFVFKDFSERNISEIVNFLKFIERFNPKINIKTLVNNFIEDIFTNFTRFLTDIQYRLFYEITGSIYQNKSIILTPEVYTKYKKEMEPVFLALQQYFENGDIYLYKHKLIKRGEEIGEKVKKISYIVTFLFSCSTPDCKGLISKDHKCSLCGAKYCEMCREQVKEIEKEIEKEQPGRKKAHPAGYKSDSEDLDGEKAEKPKIKDHKCDKKTVETIKSMAENTKPCPKCAAPIYKISGCNQMWCTQCNVAFDWVTGIIDVGGTVHNPHAFEYFQRNGLRNGANARQDIDCDDLRPRNIPGLKSELHELNRYIIHVEQVEINQLNRKIQEEIENMRKNLRSYVSGRISEQVFSKKLFDSRYKIMCHQKEVEILNTYCMIGMANLLRITQPEFKIVDIKRTQIENDEYIFDLLEEREMKYFPRLTKLEKKGVSIKS